MFFFVIFFYLFVFFFVDSLPRGKAWARGVSRQRVAKEDLVANLLVFLTFLSSTREPGYRIILKELAEVEHFQSFSPSPPRLHAPNYSFQKDSESENT